VAETIERLARRGDEVELFAERVEDVDLAVRGGARGGIRWHRVAALGGPHLMAFLAWIARNRRRRRSEARRGNPPDVVFSPGINALDADVILVHAVFHRLRELERARGGAGWRGFHRRLYYAALCRLEQKIYRDPRVILASVSPRTGEQLARYFGRNDVAVVPNGVDPERFCPQALSEIRDGCRERFRCRPGETVLLLVGNDWRNKGLPALLAAMALCRDLPLCLLVVGSDEPSPFRAEVRRLDLSRVEFFSPREDVREFYAAADLLLAPSLEDSFNLPVLEAMSSGLPVIVSPRAGMAGWLSHGRDAWLLDDPESAEELAGVLRRLAFDPDRRRALSELALQTARGFSWDAHAARLRELLEHAAGRKGAAG
jgi:UDP-glucose:(heptosyl)LPS alpha-1,3-glucosyltransferase